jgi:hypothetical protein
MEMKLAPDKWYKLRHPRQMIGYTHHHEVHHRSEQGYRSMNHQKEVKIIKRNERE